MCRGEIDRGVIKGVVQPFKQRQNEFSPVCVAWCLQGLRLSQRRPESDAGRKHLVRIAYNVDEPGVGEDLQQHANASHVRGRLDYQGGAGRESSVAAGTTANPLSSAQLRLPTKPAKSR